MMTSASKPIAGTLAAFLLFLPGCSEGETGPIRVSAIGAAPKIVNPNREPVDAATAFLLEAAAQGLVRFDAAGEIEPALAQRWTVSDDGLRYTFRLARLNWGNGSRVTAEQVVARLRSAAAPSSRNPVKPLLGAIDEVVAMTDEVLEISLKSPRPNFLQLLAQPQMAIMRNGQGLGPFRASPVDGGAVSLSLPPAGEDEPESPGLPPLLLRGAGAAAAVAAFQGGEAELVLGGTVGDLPLARAARAAGNTLVFDPVGGLFGLSFDRIEGPLETPEVRQALSMAIDRAALLGALRVPGLQPRESLVPSAIAELPQPALPAWAASPLADRRAAAAAVITDLDPQPLRLRVAMPDGPGHQLVFAHLRRDWAAIGVHAERVGPAQPAELRFVDEVAPIFLASWYLRHFRCEASRVCDPAADEMMDGARMAPDAATRRGLLASADRILVDRAAFIALAAPVRWSLVSPRLTGFRANPFGHHPAGELIRAEP
jgi:peptide/nickel transport system substrate-binding protein